MGTTIPDGKNPFGFNVEGVVVEDEPDADRKKVGPHHGPKGAGAAHAGVNPADLAPGQHVVLTEKNPLVDSAPAPVSAPKKPPK
jgi:hypothetical protein